MEKKYYWLKLKRDFFKRHDIRVIESMPNGKEYILFYLKLLLESIDHEGALRFSDTIPYNEEMLSIITDTNIDIVRSACKVLSQLNLMEILDDQTIYMTETEKMLGKIEDIERVRELARDRQKEYRKRQSSLVIEDKGEEKKQEKHKYGENKNVFLTETEYEQLKARFTDAEERINNLSFYLASTGKVYKSHYMTILNWARKDNTKTQTTPQKKTAFHNFGYERKVDYSDIIEKARKQ